MKNKKIKAIAKIERDAKNFFFVKILYGFEDSQTEPQTVFEMEDLELFESLIILFQKVHHNFICDRINANKIIVYSPETKYTYNASDKNNGGVYIFIGTESHVSWEYINYLARMLDYTMNKEKMGEFFVQYKDKIMKIKEFYEFQKNLSIFTI